MSSDEAAKQTSDGAAPSDDPDGSEEEESAEPFSSVTPISYYGADFDVHGLVRRLEEGDIVIPNFDPPDGSNLDLADFQRRFVWRKYQMDRFIESLLLGYPVPGIFLVQQADQKLLVLDGQQRLRTLRQFFAGTLENGRAFRLESVNDRLKNLSYRELADDDQRALKNSSMHATVIRYVPGDAGGEAVYQLFERLNTGGTNLYPHEIRVALYPGPLVEFIRDLNVDPDWRLLYGAPSERLKDHEQILRFLALYTSSAEYKRPLKGFLNSFLEKHRRMEGLDMEELRRRFVDTCAVLARGPGRAAFRISQQINAALVDAVMVGTARRLDRGPVLNPSDLGDAIRMLLDDQDFVGSIARATADEERVARRLDMATRAIELVD